MARITALVLACVCLQCHLVAGVPVRLEQDIEAILTERPALNPALVHEINSDENMTWLVYILLKLIHKLRTCLNQIQCQ